MRKGLGVNIMDEVMKLNVFYKSAFCCYYFELFTIFYNVSMEVGKLKAHSGFSLKYKTPELRHWVMSLKESQGRQ